MATPRTEAGPAAASPPALWDPVVRLTHWGIAAAVLLNAALDEGGSLLHVAVGWIVMALLLLRMVWGVLGPDEARFAAFPPNPLAALRHLRQLVSGRVRHYSSHNPAGALMAYAFWAALATVTVSGLVMTGGATPMQVAADKAAVASGDWSALIRDSEGESDRDDAFGEAAEEVHEVVANLLLILAALHVAGVALESRAMRRNLVAAMLTGPRQK
ncbi:cytochrome b/b6 domain-containing protein [Rhodobacter calidifons]|uniref:Cytochrome B n=1 Tax=Rhodobacter calidifons TaxID=2715277 RepID=A0ABX0G1L4_9RHOB|nr:cytochrome b/b6 domain-containing protein [Rhodobacter calidifons]NHB75167.1 cytochrome B [Rhodobacter calidifons]